MDRTLTAILCVSMAWAGTTDQPQPLVAWPDAFVGSAPTLDWAPHTIDFPNLRMHVEMPSAWTAPLTEMLPGDFSRLDVSSGRHVRIAEPSPAVMNLDEPISRKRLDDSIATLQANVPRGYVVEKAGQVRIGRRLWVWHEMRIPTFETSPDPVFKLLLRAVSFATGRSWSFVATPHNNQVYVYCSVLYRRDLSPADYDRQTRDAGAVFAEILRRLSFDPKRALPQ